MKLNKINSSLLNKLILTYLSIILITLIFLSFLLSRLFYGYLTGEREKDLARYGEGVVELTEEYLTGGLEGQDLVRNVQSFSRLAGARIRIVNREERILAESHQGGRGWMLRSLPENFNKIFAGQKIKEIGNYSNNHNLPFLIIGLPAESGGNVVAAVLIYTPVRELAGALPRVYRIIWFSALIAMVPAFISLYWISRRVVSPLYQMNKIALAMAEGKFGLKVNVESKDEVGQLANSLNYMAARLERLETTRREFLANVSHELRTPLTTIRGFVQGILDGTVEQKDQQKYLKIAFEEINRMNRLVNDLLNLTALQTGIVQLKKTPFDLNLFLTKIVDNLRFAYRKKGVKLIWHPLEDKLIVEGDQDRIGQVFLNLLNNALSHTPSGGEVVFQLIPTQQGVEIRIQDSGEGIAPQDLPYIWEKFYKADRSRSNQGTGLGLAIVKDLVALHQGKISVESKRGQGTIFVVSLPLN